MNEQQFKNFKAYIECESKAKMVKFLESEIASRGDDIDPKELDFFLGIGQSDFFADFFMRGFIEGIEHEKNMKKENINLMF